MSMEVKARYMGGNSEQGYMVNVRNANPKGMIGDAGVIRYFETKKEAKEYADLVNSTGQDVFVPRQTLEEDKPVCHSGDKFIHKCDLMSSLDNDCDEVECPHISWARAAFNRLTDEQIKAINETGKLPEGVKVVPNGMGGYTLSNNYGGLVTGTRTIPAGYEMKKDWLGFTVIVPKDTEGLLVQDAA